MENEPWTSPRQPSLQWIRKNTIAVAVAEGGRRGEVRFIGEIPSRPEAVAKMVERLTGKHGKLAFCYEAGPCGYGLHRQIAMLGHDCVVVAPSLVPTRPGDHLKTDRRDATDIERPCSAPGNRRRFLFPTTRMKPCAIFAAPVRRRWRACGGPASRF